MRRQGRLQSWNDERGFGFVEPNGGGDRAFVHVRAFRPGNRRPTDGDLITYRAERDEQGRWRAIDIDVARAIRRVETAEAERSPRTARWAALGGLYVVAIAALCAAGLWPWAVSGIVGTLSLIAFVAYWNDKRSALAGRWRTPEAHLHLIALLGGWPGAAFAQHVLRHKSKKPAFRMVFIATVILNVVAAVVLSGDEGREFLAMLASR